MGRTNIEIDEKLIREARKLTRLKAEREIVQKALELLVRSETSKGSFTTLIAAIAIEHGASLFTLDRDFARIARITSLRVYEPE